VIVTTMVKNFTFIFTSWRKSVSTESDCRRPGFDPLLEAKDFSCRLCVQTSSEVRPASCPMGTGVFSPGIKRGRSVTLSHSPHVLPRSRMNRNYSNSPHCRVRGGSGTALLLRSVNKRYRETLFSKRSAPFM
jgi:hypothetical protein